jgi:beta-glucanase (GH16 family)
MMVSRRFLGIGAVLLSTGIAQAAKYTQIESYDASNFFDKFDFFSGGDPTHGFVKYVDKNTANQAGLAGLSQGGVYLGVDNKTKTTTGRNSVRVTSKRAYTKGLFIADIAHMPVGTGPGESCGLWPAFWMFGPNWPASGEIDIIEGVHNQASNAITLHTSAGCSMGNAGSIGSSKLSTPVCSADTGCGQSTAASNNYGAGFNAIGGGVYAVEWTSQAISVWFFARNDPNIAKLANPDPATFGQPLANFVGNPCNIDQHFVSHNLVFNTDFCGDCKRLILSLELIAVRC